MYALGCSRWMALLGTALCVTLPGHAQTLVEFAQGESITPAAMHAYTAKRLDLQPIAHNYWGVKQVLEEMAMTHALNLEGEERAIERRADVGEDDVFSDLYGAAVYAQIAPACEKPADESAAKAWFDAHPDAFSYPPTARLTRIMLPIDANVGEDKTALGWEFEQMMAIASGETTLDAVVEQAEKLDTKHSAQGDLGWVLLEGDHPVIRGLREAQTGDFVGPLRDGDYAYLYHVGGRHEGRQLTWDEARTSAATRAVVWCQEQSRGKVRDELFAKYGVRFNDDAIRALFAKPTNHGAEQGSR